MGPVGSGKTVACIKEMWRLALDQYPNDDGIRKSRWAITRNTSPELRTTTLNTFRQWIPEEVAPVTQSPVLMAKMDVALPDGTRAQAEFIFLALDIEKDVRKLLSLEVTGILMNEAREQSFSVLKAARERIGRYPSLADGYSIENLPKGVVHPCKRKCVIMDTNPPSDDHWWYELAELGYLSDVTDDMKEEEKENTKRIFDFFKYPTPLIREKKGGRTEYKLNPLAENIQYLPGGHQYYVDMLAGNTADHINVMVLGNYGVIVNGRPCYPEYRDQVHCDYVKPIKGIPIALGWDFGLTPSVVVGQMSSTGQLRILAEVVSRDSSVRAFARDIVKPFLSRNFPGFEVAFSVGDPSGTNRGEGEGRAAISILNDDMVGLMPGEILHPINMGFETLPAPTNDITKRLDAVKSFLLKMVGNGEPGYLLNKSCSDLRKGKEGRYQFKRLQVAGGGKRYHDKPDKNDYSHPADAEQYLALGYLNGYDTAMVKSFADEADEFYETMTRSEDTGY